MPAGLQPQCGLGMREESGPAAGRVQGQRQWGRPACPAAASSCLGGQAAAAAALTRGARALWPGAARRATHAGRAALCRLVGGNGKVAADATGRGGRPRQLAPQRALWPLAASRFYLASQRCWLLLRLRLLLLLLPAAVVAAVDRCGLASSRAGCRLPQRAPQGGRRAVRGRAARCAGGAGVALSPGCDRGAGRQARHRELGAPRWLSSLLLAGRRAALAKLSIQQVRAP